MVHTLSAVLSVLNGEKWLEKCLSSVSAIADEIIVVDHGSTDKTVAIAKKFTKQVFQEKNDPTKIDQQKNVGFAKAKSDWIISIDADEEISEELRREIKEVLQQESMFAGYFIPRKNIIFGKWIEYTGWSPDYQLRLFQKGKGKYTSEHVHENVTLAGDVGYLQAPLIHHHYETISEFLYRSIVVYAPNEAEYRYKNGYVFSYADAIRFPFQEFLSRFFARKGYKDGFTGLILSLLMACYHFAIFSYLWEKNNFIDKEDPLLMLQAQQKTMEKEYLYWKQSAVIEKEKNSAKKVLQKIKRKLSL